MILASKASGISVEEEDEEENNNEKPSGRMTFPHGPPQEKKASLTVNGTAVAR